MCGIFGYIGKSDQAPKIVLEGLKTLEYRGYDSWGLAIRSSSKFKVQNSKFVIDKHIGKIGNALLNSQLLTINSQLAIGHTRWATHGGVTIENSHPHLDCKGQIAVVHNGIVENFQELKKELIKKNHKFVSQTDTEVISHLIEEYLKKKPFKDAVRLSFKSLKGLNAIVVVGANYDEIISCKTGSPLVAGIGKDENFVSSDPSALLPYTKTVVFMDDGDMMILNRKKIEVFNVDSGQKRRVKKTKLDWEINEVSRGKFEHFMLKEIFEQPKVLSSIAANGKEIEKLAKIVKNARGTFLIGCGSASYACLAGTYLFSRVAHKHVNFSIGSEFGYLEDYLNKRSLVIAVSQSGETMDVIQPTQRAQLKGTKIVALTNVLGSTLYRNSDYKVLLGAGPEMAVCATKSITAMVANLIFLAYCVAGRTAEGRKIILETAKAVGEILTEGYIDKVKKLAKKISKINDVYIIGRGLSYAAALEATLKLKEVSYIHSEGFAGGELKHGVIALIEKGTPCIVFAPNDETYEEVISNATEIKARGGFIIGVSPKENPIFDEHLKIGDVKEGSFIAGSVPIQLLAYYLAIERGVEDPDKPRNLAKSVTVK